MRKAWLKKATVAILSLVMVVSCMAYAPVLSARAGDIEVTDKDTGIVSTDMAETVQSEYGLKGISLDKKMNVVSTLSQPTEKSVALPATWNSVKKGWVTKVKDQNPYGTCWAFAANSAMETNLIKKGIKVDGVIATKKNLNFSAKHTAYFSYHPFNDPLNNNKGDSAVFEPNTSYLDFGGNGLMAAVTIANGEGPWKTSKVPYNDKEVAKKKDYKALAHLKDMSFAPMYGATGNWNLSCVKKMVKNYGSVVLTFGYFGDGDDGNGNYYYPYGDYTNHDVTIVGWNDNYSKNNFGEYKPEKNGAWLVKNSWGTGWGQDGYFWISYYEPTCTYAWGYDMVSKNSYHNNYFYTNMPNILDYGEKTTTKIANTYTINSKEKITSIGFGCSNDKMKYKIQIYKNSKKGKPESGTKLLSTPLTGTYKKAGFHTVILPTPIKVNAGDVITVVIKMVSKDGDPVYVWYDWGNMAEGYESFMGTYTTKSSGRKAMVNFGEGWMNSEYILQGDLLTPCINMYTKNR